MARIKNTLTCMLLAALISLALCGVFFIHRATEAISEVRATRVALTGQVAAIRVDALKEIDKQADGLRKELHGDIRLVNAQVSEIASKADRQLTTMQGTVLMLGGKLDPAVASLTKLEDTATLAIAPTINIARNASDTSDLLLQCEYLDPVTGAVLGGNQDCLANRLIPALKSVEKMANSGSLMADAGAKAAPIITAKVVSIAGSADGIAKSADTYVAAFTKPMTFWQKVKTFTIFGATVAGKLSW